jgi:hypothetical protein
VRSRPWMSILYAGGSKRILKCCLSTPKMHSMTLQADVCRRLKSSSLFFGLIFISKSCMYINYSPDTSTAPLRQMVTYSMIKGQEFITHRETSVSQIILPWGDNEIMCFCICKHTCVACSSLPTTKWICEIHIEGQCKETILW